MFIDFQLSLAIDLVSNFQIISGNLAWLDQPHLFLLWEFLLLQLLDTVLQTHNSTRGKHQGRAEVMVQAAIGHVLYLVQFQGRHNRQFIQLLLLLQLFERKNGEHGQCWGHLRFFYPNSRNFLRYILNL